MFTFKLFVIFLWVLKSNSGWVFVRLCLQNYCTSILSLQLVDFKLLWDTDRKKTRYFTYSWYAKNYKSSKCTSFTWLSLFSSKLETKENWKYCSWFHIGKFCCEMSVWNFPFITCSSTLSLPKTTQVLQESKFRSNMPSLNSLYSPANILIIFD